MIKLQKKRNASSEALSNLKEGDAIAIGTICYEVIKIARQADIAIPPAYRVRWFTAIDLHQCGHASILPTHELRYYPSLQRLLLLKHVQKQLEIVSDKLLPREIGIVRKNKHRR